MRVSDQRFTDDEIRQARFRCDDPLAQVRVVSQVPEGVELLRLENRYDLPKTVPKIRCAACGRAIHRKGFTGILTNGDRILLGSKCGAETFGSWTAAEREFEDLLDRQYYLKRIDMLRAMAPDLLYQLVLWGEVAEQFEATLGQIRAEMPELFAAMRRVACSDGQLKREQRMQRRVVTQSGVKPTTVIEIVSDGLLPARPAIANPTPLAVVRQASTVIGQLAAPSAAGNEETRATRLAADYRVAEAALSQLPEVYRALRSLPELFDHSNLERLMRWAKRANVRGHYEHDGNALLAADGWQILLHQNYLVPDQTLAELLADFWNVTARQKAA